MRAVCIIAAIAVFQLAGQPRSTPLKPPFGPANELVSPDGAYALFGSEAAPHLWLEDQRTHERRQVAEMTVQTLSLAWSPDSTAYIVNDRFASDIEMAYIYRVDTLDRLDLRSRILAADPPAARFVPGPDAAPHSYVHAIRWLDVGHVEVQLHGHTDGVWDGTSVLPGQCFDLRYRIARDGVVEKLGEHVASLASKACAAME